tara:strand:+ start:291 stop:542 length:252 start_codon:yes stop_codon:yes gene_type:complete
MAMSKKKAPSTTDPTITRALKQIYDDINEIIDAVNNSQTTIEDKPYTGKEGDIRLIRLGDGSYEIQGRASDGWVATAMTFKEK